MAYADGKPAGWSNGDASTLCYVQEGSEMSAAETMDTENTCG